MNIVIDADTVLLMSDKNTLQLWESVHVDGIAQKEKMTVELNQSQTLELFKQLQTYYANKQKEEHVPFTEGEYITWAGLEAVTIDKESDGSVKVIAKDDFDGNAQLWAVELDEHKCVRIVDLNEEQQKFLSMVNDEYIQ